MGRYLMRERGHDKSGHETEDKASHSSKSQGHDKGIG